MLRRCSVRVCAAPAGEYLVASDPQWLRGLVIAYNAAYAGGLKLMVVLLTTLTLLAAPFLGMAAAGYSIGLSFLRTVAVAVGRNVADELGYGTLVR